MVLREINRDISGRTATQHYQEVLALTEGNLYCRCSQHDNSLFLLGGYWGFYSQTKDFKRGDTQKSLKQKERGGIHEVM